MVEYNGYMIRQAIWYLNGRGDFEVFGDGIRKAVYLQYLRLEDVKDYIDEVIEGNKQKDDGPKYES